jgi:DNA polymerase (family 10)
VRMLGHLSARMIGARPAIELDLPQVFEAARDHGIAIEINGALPRLDPGPDALAGAVRCGTTFLLTSDAHATTELALSDFAARHAFRARVPVESVANAWPRERLLSFVGSRHA